MTKVQIQPVKITGTHRYSYKKGETGEIIGIKWVKPDPNTTYKLCYHILWPDGKHDFWAAEDFNTFKISFPDYGTGI